MKHITSRMTFSSFGGFFAGPARCATAIVREDDSTGPGGAIAPPEFIKPWPLPEEQGAAHREIYALYGLAMYRAQVFEHEVINALFVLEFLPNAKEKYSSNEEFHNAREDYSENLFGHTLGTLIKRLLAQPPQFPESLKKHLDEGRVVRDHLAHRFFRERAYEWVTRVRMEKMLDELVDAANTLIRADHALSSFMEPQKAKFGSVSPK